MKSFTQYIEESRVSLKGWINPKTKKAYTTKRMRPYHVEFIIKKPRDFGVSKKQILDYLEKKYDLMDAPDPAEEAKKAYSNMLTGKIDIDRNIEVMAMNKGWHRVVGGSYGEIAGVKKLNDKQVGVILSMMEDEGLVGDAAGVYTKEISLDLYEPSDRPDVNARTRYYGEVKGHEIQNLIKGKPRGSKRTEIGRTMAMFREAVDPKTLLKKFNALKKGDTIKVKYKSSMSSSKAPLELVVTSGKRTVGKAKVERIILKSKSNPRGVKYYLYNRDGKVSFAVGDMGASIETLDEGVRDAIKKLAKNKKVMGLVSKMKGKNLKQLAVALAALPAVTDTLSNPDRMNQIRIIANGLKSMVEDNEDAIV